jgi:hypothetical protein
MNEKKAGPDVVIIEGITDYILPSNVDLTVDKSACQDRHKRCKIDAANGECNRNPG